MNMESDYFYKTMQFVFQWEGGYVNDPDDPGGATNYGITQRTFDAWRDLKRLGHMDVKDMSKLDALQIYQSQYWKPEWAHLGFPLAACMLDTAVNMGMGRAFTFLKNCNNNYVTYLQLRLAKYNELIEKNPSLAKFRKGWMNRLTDLRRFIDGNKDG